MSWRSLSATNDTHRNSKLSAKKVIVKNIVISQETTMGSMDVSNLEYTRDDYSGNILTIEETLRGPDISLNRIKVLNQSDTSGVVKFVKPFVAPSAGLEGLRAYDGSFTTTNVLRDFQVGSVTKRDGDIIEILNDASFSNHITAPDVCANVIGSRNPTNGLPIYLSADVSINGGLQCSDISVSHIHPLDAATKLLVNNDISASGAIYASDLSGFTFRAVDVSVNDMYGANGHIDVVADISVNGVIQVTEISMNMLGGHNNRITIHNDLSVNGDLIVGEDLTLSNLFTTSDYIHFHNVTDISNDIKNLDISVGEIYPKELGNERFVKRESIEKETLILNGDVSFSGRVEADWVESDFNVLDQVSSLATLISNTAEYPIGTLLQVKGEKSTQVDIFIKTNKESWYKLKSTNATPLFTLFDLSYNGSTLLAGDFSGDITNTNIDTGNYFYYPTSLEYPDVSVGLQRYEEVGGFGDYDEVVFYVKKIKDEENNVYFFDISGTDSENDDIAFSLIGDKTLSDFSYLNGAGWGLSSVNSVENDISRIHVKVPINNGFDLSFIVRADDKISTFNDKIITIKKINEVPVWKHMVLEASNYQYIHDEGYDIASDASFNTEEWYSIYKSTYLQYNDNHPILPIDYSKNIPSIINYNIPDDVSHTFNVRYYNPAKFNSDTSYYILDLSSLDPESFDVCYEIQTANNEYLTHDWSWNLDGSKVRIKVPGEDKSNPEDLDFSFEIISHDNNVEDVSGFVPTDFYSFNGEDVSKRIVNFHKEIFKPEFNYLSFERGVVVFYTETNITDDLSLTDLHFNDNGDAYYDISFHYLYNSPTNINFNYYDKLAHDVLLDTTVIYNQAEGNVEGLWTVALYDSSCNVTKPNNILASNTLILQLVGKFSYSNNISRNIYLNIDAFEPEFYINKIDFIFNTSNTSNTSYTYQSTYNANHSINNSTSSSTTVIDLIQNNNTKIDYQQVYGNGNNFGLTLEDIVVHVSSNYTTEWYYFSMVNNSKEIFNNDPINITNTYTVVSTLDNPVIHSVWDDTASSYNVSPRIKKYTTNLHLQRKQISQLTPSRTSDDFPETIPITLYTYKFYSTNLPSSAYYNSYDNKIHFNKIPKDGWIRIDKVDGLTGGDRFIELLYIAGGGNGGSSGMSRVDYDWSGSNEWGTGGGGGCGGSGGYFYVKIDRTIVHGESILIKFVGDNPADRRGEDEDLFKMKGFASDEITITFNTLADNFSQLSKSKYLGGENGGPGWSSGGGSNPHGGGGGGGGLGAEHREPGGEGGGSGDSGAMNGGKGGGAGGVRHKTGLSSDAEAITVRDQAYPAAAVTDTWYDLKSGAGGIGASAHAHGAPNQLTTNTNYYGYGGSAGNNYDAGFYLRFVTDVNAQ